MALMNYGMDSVHDSQLHLMPSLPCHFDLYLISTQELNLYHNFLWLLYLFFFLENQCFLRILLCNSRQKGESIILFRNILHTVCFLGFYTKAINLMLFSSPTHRVLFFGVSASTWHIMHSWLWLARLTTALDKVQMDAETIFRQVHHRKNQWFKDQVGSTEVLRHWEYIAVMPLGWGLFLLLFFLLFERPMKYLNKEDNNKIKK